MNAPRESLVQYDPPIEVGPSEKSDTTTKKRKPQLPSFDTKPNMEDILNWILPPREWDSDGKHSIQFVSKIPEDSVANLQKQLDERLLARQARESGICAIREELHAQCFDEIIRQVTIECPERGILLMRVRDELKMTIDAYQTLYQSSVTFNMRKELQAAIGRPDLEEKISKLQKKKAELEEKKAALIQKKEGIERANQERRAIAVSKRAAEIDFLKYQDNNTVRQLKKRGSLIESDCLIL